MATDGAVLAYDPAFVLGLTPDELVGVVAHEVLHCALAHTARRGGRDPARWNVACDLAVNPVLLEAGFVLPGGRLVSGEGAFAALRPGRSADEYYAALPANTAGGAADPGGCGGVRPPAAGDPAAAAQAEAGWRAAVAQAEWAARGRGDLPAGPGRQVGRALRPPADWRDVLREFVSSSPRADYSWARPDRRHVGRGLYLPGLRSEALGEVVVAVDTSGSVGPADPAVFAAELDALLSAYAYDCTATVLYHDTKVRKVETWTPADGPLALAPVGGGGTDHRCVFDWVEAGGPSPAVVVCLTDLETVFPPAPPAAPVLWAVVGGGDADPPFGTRVSVGP